jgi:hypothetical protein
VSASYCIDVRGNSYGVTAYHRKMVASARRLHGQSRAPAKLHRQNATEYRSRTLAFSPETSPESGSRVSKGERRKWPSLIPKDLCIITYYPPSNCILKCGRLIPNEYGVITNLTSFTCLKRVRFDLIECIEPVFGYTFVVIIQHDMETSEEVFRPFYANLMST